VASPCGADQVNLRCNPQCAERHSQGAMRGSDASR
jgi:hypothetical protein